MDNFSQGLSREAGRNISQVDSSDILFGDRRGDKGKGNVDTRIGISLPADSRYPYSGSSNGSDQLINPSQNKNGHHIPEASSHDKPSQNKNGHHTPEASGHDKPSQNKNGHHAPEAGSHDRPHNKNGHHEQHGRDNLDGHTFAELQILAMREMERLVQQELMMMKMMERQMVKDGVLPPCQIFDDSSSEGQQLASRNSQKKESELGSIVKTGVKAAISMLI